jgi:murein DD-endopeptidase MepM/ murein hydrolase activator NlpD
VESRSKSRREKRVSLTSRLYRIREKRKRTVSQLRHTKGAQRDVVADLHTIQNAVQRTSERIAGMERRLAATQRELARTQSRLEKAQAEMERDQQRLARRMVAARRSEGCDYLSVTLGAKDLGDFLDREHFVSKIVRLDADLIRSIREKAEEIAEEKAALNERRAEQQRWAKELAAKREEQKQEYARQKAVYDRLKRERTELEGVLAQQERDSESVRAMLQALAQTPEGHARALVSWTGRFSRPVNGRLTSGFGRRYHPILHVWKLHTGVDFGVPVGTVVHAAAGGVVVRAGWLGAYGNAVIIDHGGGVSTLYGHCSSLSVSAGERVSAGQAIGRSGSTGYSTGPHLHFEKRVNGSPVPPY